MPKLDEQTQAARREHILDAAERCFARNGFHSTSMQDICREAEISPGGLYGYFASKDDLIVGICGRESQRFAEQFAVIAEAPDFLAALTAMAEHMCFAHPREKLLLHMEIGAEACRNQKVREAVRRTEREVALAFEDLIERVRQEGRIAPKTDSATLTRALAVVGDGLFWHRAIDPDFMPAEVLPALMAMISTLINPINTLPPAGGARTENKNENEYSNDH